jgi:GDP-L-fucose synthase
MALALTPDPKAPTFLGMFTNILVPGGHGFLGQAVMKELAAKGYNAVAVSKRDGVDFLSQEQTNAFFEKIKPDAVINCAAVIGGLAFVHEHPGSVLYQNTLLNLHLMEAARVAGVQLYVNPLANCSYPGKASVFKEDEWWDGPLHESVLAFGFTKKASWVQAWAYAQQYGFQTSNLILPNMYGPGDYFDPTRSHALGALIMKFVTAKQQNAPHVIVWGDGTPIREWLYVEDAAELLVRALSAPPVLGPMNVGVGKGISILDLANVVKETVGYEGQIVLDPTKPNGAPVKIMNVDLQKQLFAWEPKTNLREGIQKTIAWYLQELKQAR